MSYNDHIASYIEEYLWVFYKAAVEVVFSSVEQSNTVFQMIVHIGGKICQEKFVF